MKSVIKCDSCPNKTRIPYKRSKSKKFICLLIMMFVLCAGDLQPLQFPAKIQRNIIVLQPDNLPVTHVDTLFVSQQVIEQPEFSDPEDSTTIVISKYDDIFRKYSRKIGWDWRLLAALVFHESSFRPTVRSSVGAYGLMQLMPSTLEFLGIDSTATPDRHIEAGVDFLKYLDTMFIPYIPEKDERIKFILASYNIGPGHVLDARRLAKKYGKNDGIWNNNVDSFLIHKSKPKFYTDPNVRHGKCYGKETFAFVKHVTEQFEYYKNMEPKH